MTRIVGGRWGGRRLVTPVGNGTRPTSEKVRAALASSLTAAGGLEGARVLDLYAGSGALGLELVSRGASSAVFVEQDRAALVALRANLETLGAASVRDKSAVRGSSAIRGGPTSGGVTSGGVTSRGVTSGGVTSGGVTSGGVTSGGATSRGATSGGLTGAAATSAPTLTVVPGDVAAFTVRASGLVPAVSSPFDVVLADPPYDLAGDQLLAILLGLHDAGLLAPHADLVLERSRRAGEPAWPEPLEAVRVKKYGDTLLCYGRAP